MVKWETGEADQSQDLTLKKDRKKRKNTEGIVIALAIVVIGAVAERNVKEN